MRTRPAARSFPAHPFEQLEPRALFSAVPTVAWTGPPGPIDSVITGDVNNDGLLDTVIASGHDILLLLGRGDATFDDPRVTSIAGYVGRLALGHFDGDDSLDLVSAGTALPNHRGPTYVRAFVFDSATSTFRLTSRRPLRDVINGIATLSQLVVGDLVPDGRDDIALITQAPTSHVDSDLHVVSVVGGQLIDSGRGGGASISTPARTLIGTVETLAPVRFDAAGPARLIAGVGHNFFTRSVLISITPIVGVWHVSPVRAFQNAIVSSCGAADLDADGRSELLVATVSSELGPIGSSEADSLIAFTPRSSGGFDPSRIIGAPVPLASPVTMANTNSMSVLDVRGDDNDGFVDVLVLRSRSGNGYTDGTSISITNSQAELVLVSTNPMVSSRDLWSGFQQHEDPTNIDTGSPFPSFIGEGVLISGSSVPGLVGVLGGATIQLQVFDTLTSLLAP